MKTDDIIKEMRRSECECKSWVRFDNAGFRHHPNCPHANNMLEATALISLLARSIECVPKSRMGWQMIDAYRRALVVLGEIERLREFDAS